MRPDQTSAERLAARLAQVESVFADHRYYGPDNLHLTVFGIHDKLVSELVLNHLHRFLAAHVCALQPLAMPLGGLAMVGNTLVIKAFDPVGNLLGFTRTAMKELYDEIYGEGIDVQSMIGLHSDIFWLSAARLAENADRALLDYVRQCFEESLGEAYFEEMLLCRTDQLFRPEHTQVLRRYALGESC
jgi:hypothetical protein